jgi:hypothetical protein
VDTNPERNNSNLPVIVIAGIVIGVKLALYLAAAGGYGYFRDELYFLACTEHLAWGYPDHAPLSVFAAWASRAVLGDSLYAIRLLPALSGMLKIVLTAIFVRELSGGRIATLLACLCVLVAPVYLAADNLLAMNTFEPLFWTGCALAYVWAVKRENPRYWLLFGALAGLGTMNKHSMVFFCAAFAVALLLTRDRAFFKSSYLWIAAVLALLIFLPNIIWQYQNNWATLELLRNVQTTGKNVVVPPHEFVVQQAFIMLPFTAPIWLAGLWYYLFDRNGRRFRTLGITYVLTLVIMLLLRAKHYYFAPVYPIMFAAGAVFWESILFRTAVRRAVAYGYAGVLVVTGAVFAPIALPLLPVDQFVAYQDTIGIKPPKSEVGHTGPLPQHLGDMFGWPEMVEKVAAVYNSLPPGERERTAIYGSNYGEAGAIDHFGPAYGLPKAISSHQSYFLWGPRAFDGSTIILLGSKRAEAEGKCESLEERDEVGHPYAMGEEHFTILVCRGLKTPLSQTWHGLKHWN